MNSQQMGAIAQLIVNENFTDLEVARQAQPTQPSTTNNTTIAEIRSSLHDVYNNSNATPIIRGGI